MLDFKAEFQNILASERFQQYAFAVADEKYILDVVRTKNEEHECLRVTFTLAGKGCGIHNTGHAIKTFSAVINFLQDIAKTTGVSFVSFAAKNSQPSRVKLYNRFCQHMLMKNIIIHWQFEDEKNEREYLVKFKK